MSHEPSAISHPLTLKLFFVILLILAISPTAARAYDLIQSPEPFTMRGEREEAPPSARKGLFTVQDNFNPFTRNDGITPILLPHSDYFIAADMIDVNMPIFNIFSHPAMPNQDPLANLLYANLQLKKILEEYNEIQERAKELLALSSSTTPFGMIKIALPVRPHNSIKHELDQVKSKLSQASSEIAGNDSMTSTQRHKRLTLERKLGTNLYEIKSLASQQPTNFFSASRGTQSNAIGKISTQNNKINQKIYQPEEQSITQSSSRNNSEYIGAGEISLPWILELPSKIFDYIFAHKIIAVIILLCVLMFFNLIFGSGN